MSIKDRATITVFELRSLAEELLPRGADRTSLQERIRISAAEMRTLASEYLAINETALEIWKEADEAGVHLHDLPSLSLFVKESHGFWMDCAHYGQSDLENWDRDNADDRYFARKLNRKLIEATFYKGARQRDFAILAERSRAELQAKINEYD